MKQLIAAFIFIALLATSAGASAQGQHGRGHHQGRSGHVGHRGSGIHRHHGVQRNDHRAHQRGYRRQSRHRGGRSHRAYGYRHPGYNGGHHRWNRGHRYGQHYGYRQAYRHSGYYGPRHRWARGHRYQGPIYVVRDYPRYGLRIPPYGYRWVRSSNEYLLVAIATGVILDIALR